MNNQIDTLAVAMGLDPSETYDMDCSGYEAPAFNPFIDANDDYSVLEWMRRNFNEEDVANALEQIDKDEYGYNRMKQRYYIGNFAAAALCLLKDKKVEV